MKKVIIISLLFFLLLPPALFSADELAVKLSGRILLQVEENGEAWYVYPEDLKRYFLGRPDDAFKIMREKGIGITNNDLEKIPLSIDSLSGVDTDQDGLSDIFEDAIGSDKNKKDTDDDDYNDKAEIINGYKPNENKKFQINQDFAANNIGNIFLQVEGSGEAWYIDPVSKKRYFLGRPNDAFNVMRSLGLGITNSNLAKINLPIEVLETEEINNLNGSSFVMTSLEERMHDLINIERKNEGQGILSWNDELASVAREHSQSLANENINLSDPNKSCHYPMIHHEGIDFGLHNADRLFNRDIVYFSGNAENIALLPTAYYTLITSSFIPCKEDINKLKEEFDIALAQAEGESAKIFVIKNEIEKREEMMLKETKYTLFTTEKLSEDDIAKEAVNGWMNSPGHRANILNMNYDEAGLGIATFEGYVIATQVFIKRAECGYKDGPCCVKNGCYIPFSCQSGICRE